MNALPSNELPASFLTHGDAARSSNPVFLGLPQETSLVADQSSKLIKNFPMSEALSELWLHSQWSEDANCTFNESTTLRLQGDVAPECLRVAIDQTIARHEMLRSTFSSDGQQVLIWDQPRYTFEEIDWTHLAESELITSHHEAIARIGKKGMDLAAGPLLHFRLAKISSSEYWLTFTAHHLIIDGWSAFVFFRDLGHLYTQQKNREWNLQENLSIVPKVDSYQHYVQCMQQYAISDQGKSDASYWQKQYAEPVMPLDLPTDRPRPTARTFESSRFDYRIGSKEVARMRQAGAKSGCSLFQFLLAGLYGYLARVTGQSDFAIGIPTAGQSVLSLPNLVGHCVHTMPFRFQVDLEKTALEVAKGLRSRFLDALDHQRFTFGSLMRLLNPPRDPSRPPVFAVMFNLDPPLDERELGFERIDCKLAVEPRTHENFEWFINGVSHQDGSLILQVQFNLALFDRETIASHMEGFEAFLVDFASHPDIQLQDLNTLSLRQRQEILVHWNQTQMDYPSDTSILDEIEKQAAKTPSQVAVITGEGEFTYEHILKQANRLARFLSSQKVQHGDRVGICLPRSVHMLTGVLACWKLGAAYVPLDPAYPIERLKMVCDDAELKVVLTHREMSGKLEGKTHAMIDLDEAQSVLASYEDSSLEPLAQPADVAYMIYTSGSTGKPKGVQVPHGAVVNFLYSMQQRPGFQSQDRILAITTLAFDISILELYLPLVCGGSLVIASQNEVTDGRKLLHLIRTHKVSILQATPSTWRMLLDAGLTRENALKALCGGEAFPRDLISPMLDRCREVWNMYGPTETTVWSTAFQVVNASDPICIGRPIGNTQAYLLDHRMKEVPVGSVGELYLGGAGVTYGYWQRDELTKEKFVDNPYFNPFVDYLNVRLYRTGDLARWRRDGTIEYLRRNDKQIKLRGHRIELEEIEQHLLKYPQIRQAIASVREDHPGDARLVAYFITSAGESITASDLRSFLRTKLPAYMVPQHFVEVAEFPKTANGKIDLKQLPSPAGNREMVATPPRTKAEKWLSQIWSELLNVSPIHIHDNFFHLGGHSLLVMRAIESIERLTGTRLSPPDFLAGTLESIACKINETVQSGPTTGSDFAPNEHRDVDPVSDDPATPLEEGLWKKVANWIRPNANP